MVLVFSAFLDPAAEHHCFVGGERLANLGGRHHRVGIAARDSDDELTLAGVMRHDRRGAAFERSDGGLAGVEPQAGLTILLVGAVAGEAAIRQERPHVPVEVQRSIRRPEGWCQQAGTEHEAAVHGRHGDGVAHAHPEHG